MESFNRNAGSRIILLTRIKSAWLGTLWLNKSSLCAAIGRRAWRWELTANFTWSWLRKVHVVPWGPRRNILIISPPTWSDTLLLIQSSISRGCRHEVCVCVWGGIGEDRYLIWAFSGMFMMWISSWSPEFRCGGTQLLREDWVCVSSFMKCFCDTSSSPSAHTREPGLVPAKTPMSHLSSLRIYRSTRAPRSQINEFKSP